MAYNAFYARKVTLAKNLAQKVREARELSQSLLSMETHTDSPDPDEVELWQAMTDRFTQMESVAEGMVDAYKPLAYD